MLTLPMLIRSQIFTDVDRYGIYAQMNGLEARTISNVAQSERTAFDFNEILQIRPLVFRTQKLILVV